MRVIKFSVAFLAFQVCYSCFAVEMHETATGSGPEPSVPLFDGKTLSGWKQLTGKAIYKVEDGAIVGVTVAGSPNSFLATEKTFGDFVLEMDVKIEDTSSNSGVQFRSHFDPLGNNGAGKVFGCQYELDPSSRQWTAGIYDEGRRDWLYPMTLHPLPKGSIVLNRYNRVRIECVGNETRTFFNGMPAADLVDAMDSSGFIALQVHAIGNAAMAGRKIYFKNILIGPLKAFSVDFPAAMYTVNTLPNQLSDSEKKHGWTLLFDGATTNGWRGAYKPAFPEKGWVVRDNTLTVLASNGAEGGQIGGDIVTTGEYSAFDLSFEFKITPGANSGVKYFVTLSENNRGSAIGLEYQVLDDSLHPDAKLGRNGDRTLASLYDLIPAAKQRRFIHPVGEWNTGRIVVYPNNHVEHYLNGIKVLEYERGSAAYRDLVSQSKYKIWTNFGEAAKGHILLQDHGNEASYRSVKIRLLN
jgi:Domain of Unknown Function (DUF1080)